ncbi:unnamed protein product [Caenorhabditis nigoni]
MDKPKEKEFMIRHVFNDMNRVVSQASSPPTQDPRLRLREAFSVGDARGPTEMRYGILEWKGSKFYLCCELENQPRGWSIDAEIEMKFVGKHDSFVKKSYARFKQYHACERFYVDLSDIQKYKDGDKLRVEWRVKYKQVNEYDDEPIDVEESPATEYQEDKPTVALVVGKEKFEADKKFLADNCTYFNTIFFETSDEYGKTETEIDDCIILNFLRILKGEQDIDHKSINRVLELSFRFGSNPMLAKCEEFLMKKSKKSIKIKFNTAIKYKLHELKKKCLSDMKSKKVLAEVGSQNADNFPASVWKELFQQLISLD